MAPKRAAAAKAGGRGKQAKASPAQEAGEDAQLETSGSRFLGRRDTEDYADRAVQDHFPHASLSATRLRKVEGKSMRDCILQERRRLNAINPKLRIGAKFWGLMRETYLSDSAEEFVVEDPSQPLQPLLEEALFRIGTKQAALRNRGALPDWLSTTNSCNQRELVSVFRILSQHQSLRTKFALQLFLDCLRMMARLNLTQYEWCRKLLDSMQSRFDAALVSSWADHKGMKWTEAEWWSEHRFVGKVVVDEARFEAVLALPEDEWYTKAEDLGILVATSALGKKLFGHKAAVCMSTRLVQKLQEDLAALRAPITAEKLNQVKKTSSELEDGMQANKSLACKRMATIGYRRVEAPVEVCSWAQELAHRVDMWLLSHAVDAGRVAQYSFEDGIFTKPDVADLQVDADLLKQFQLTRKSLTKMLGHASPSGAVITDLMKSKSHVLAGNQKSVVVEVAVFRAIHASKGTAILQQQVLDASPAANRYRTPDAVVVALKALQRGNLYRMCSVDGRCSVDAPLQQWEAIAGGGPPNTAELTGSDFAAAVCASFIHSYKYQQRIKDKTKEFKGIAGIKTCLQDCLAKHAEGGLTFDKLTDIQTFAYVLSAPERKQVDEMTVALLGSVKTASKRKSSAAPQPSKKGQPAQASSSSSSKDERAALLAALTT